MANTQTPKSAKPRLYKMVTYQGGPSASKSGATIKVGKKTVAGGGSDYDFKRVISGLNSLGATLNSIAIITESINNNLTKSLQDDIKRFDSLSKLQKTYRKVDQQTTRKKDETERKQRQKDKDKESEKQSESGLKKALGGVAKAFAAATGGFWQGIAQIFTAIFRSLIIWNVLDWISKPANGEKLQSIIKGVIGIITFFKNLLSFGVGATLDGITDLIKNPLSIQGVFGAVKLLLGVGALFIGMRWLKNPANIIKDTFTVLKIIGKGVVNLKTGSGVYQKIRKFAGTKAGKIALAAGGGVGRAAAGIAFGEDKAQAIGAGVGTAAGAVGGEMLGQAIAGPIGGMIGGALGGMAGGAIGGGIGKLLSPIFKPIGDFFKMIGDVINAFFDPIKNALTDVFKAIGDLGMVIVGAIKPYMPFIKQFAALAGSMVFGPLLLVLKGITSLIRFFVPKQEDSSKNPKNRSVGGPVVVPQMAVGGSIPPTPPVMTNPVNAAVQQALSNAMLLPFKAVGIGLISAMSVVASVFGKFLPGPIQSLLGASLAPIASIFGVPMTVFKKVSGVALDMLKGGAGAAGQLTQGISSGLNSLFGGKDVALAGKDKDGKFKPTPDRTVNGLLGNILGALVALHENQGASATTTAPPDAAAVAAISGPADMTIGDSVARGLAGNGATPGTTADAQMVGRKSKETLEYIKGLDKATLKGKTIRLSSGILNSPDDMSSVEQQLKYLKEAGATVQLVGTPTNNPKYAPLNDKLKTLAAQYGASFMGGYTAGTDQLHPADYAGMRAKYDAVTPKPEDTKPQPSQMARGGWINGPMSGYPVSLNGGRSTSFIGHGREWVGFKGRAAGGSAGSAFVIPFNTPATRRNPGLTSMRMRQAKSGGYSLPRSIGGLVPFRAEGGPVKFDPSEYSKGMKATNYITNPGGTDKSYVIGFTQNGTDFTIKQINKVVKDNLIGPDDLTGVKPGSDEWKKVIESSNTLAEFKNRWVPALQSSKVKVTVDPNASIYYGYNQAYQTTKNEWLKKGVSPKQAEAYAAKAAQEFAIASKGASRLPGSKGGLDASLQNVDVASGASGSTAQTEQTPPDPFSALEEAFKKLGEAYGVQPTGEPVKTDGKPNQTGDTLSQQNRQTAEARRISQEAEAKAKIQREVAAAGNSVAASATAKPAIVPGSGGSGAPPQVISSGKDNSADSNKYLAPRFGVFSDINQVVWASL
jgi:hypothetical protein